MHIRISRPTAGSCRRPSTRPSPPMTSQIDQTLGSSSRILPAWSTKIRPKRGKKSRPGFLMMRSTSTDAWLWPNSRRRVVALISFMNSHSIRRPSNDPAQAPRSVITHQTGRRRPGSDDWDPAPTQNLSRETPERLVHSPQRLGTASQKCLSGEASPAIHLRLTK